MLFTARSPTFLQAEPNADIGAATLLGTATNGQKPWLVMTFLVDDVAEASWETVCALRIDDLLAHLKSRANSKVAELLYMAPPRWSTRKRWSRFRVTSVNRGTYNGASVLVYNIAGGTQLCLDTPNVEPADVTKLRPVLQVDWYRHFEN